MEAQALLNLWGSEVKQDRTNNRAHLVPGVQKKAFLAKVQIRSSQALQQHRECLWGVRGRRCFHFSISKLNVIREQDNQLFHSMIRWWEFSWDTYYCAEISLKPVVYPQRSSHCIFFYVKATPVALRAVRESKINSHFECTKSQSFLV